MPHLRVQAIDFVFGDCDVRRGVQAGVNLHPVTHVPAQQLINRHVHRLGRDVPEAMVNRCNGRQAQRACRKTGLQHQILQQKLYAPRVMAP